MLRRLRSLWRALVNRTAFEDAMDAEIRFHLESRAADLVRRGLSPADAARRARIEFGNPDAWQDACRDAKGLRVIDDLRQDLRFAWRTARRHTLLASLVVVTLAFGIGISSGVFTMLSAATLRPPLPDRSGSFVRVHAAPPDTNRARPFARATLEHYVGLRDRLTAIRMLAASRNFAASIAGSGAERALLVSCNFFEVYGVPRAAIGRLLVEGDCERREPAVVLAHDTWRRRFDADPAIVGRIIAVAGVPLTVVGVAGPEFSPDSGSVWLPYTLRATFYPRPPRDSSGEDRWLELSGRLAPGATIGQAQAEVEVATAALDRARPGQRTAVLVTDGALIHDLNVRGNVIGLVTLTMGALTALVLIVCGNVATLLLSQAAGRHQEMAIRLAMGAGRGRLIRMLLTETLALAAIAGIGAYFVARAVPPVLLASLTQRPPAFSMDPDWRVFTYLTASVVLAGVAAGLAPALEALREDLLTSLKGQRSLPGSRNRPRTQAVLVGGQVALGFVLLNGAALFVATHYQIVTRDPGYESHHVLMPRVSYTRSPGAPQPPEPAALRDAIAPLPGARTIAFVATAPGFGGEHIDVARPGGEAVTANTNHVSPEFFAAIDLPVLRGRPLDQRDAPCGAGGCDAVISDALSRRLFPAGDDVGSILQTASGSSLRVVGVAAGTSGQSPGRPDPPALYLPWSNDGRPYQALVRFDGDATAFAARTAAALRERFPGSVVDAHTLRWPLEQWLDEVGNAEQLVVALGMAAATLAVLGVFGVVSFAVTRREKEFAIRLALGATRAQVYATVVDAVSRPATAGLAAGLAAAPLAAAGFSQVVAALQFSVSPFDPRLSAAAALPLAVAIAVALLIPARRVTSLEPLRVLKQE